ncbi:energy-coupling factor transporter transmembrane component T [Sporolactobacillus sp. CQH2019]|uniref:energy-coupling factor transporter transmembrane component T family protein n=1 Tax=Sporolactobacillus sp. CQH2019 TaxID=3023512 RepID=UPI002368643F|nr:energy-coupling factor transporter transmembrane component T [Sporolactobacillus sp. CQH2019]MDD9148744.1 energy-coupling factor transporter transmembrane component T [Sporolactobacillus sp. CQH2019]
MGDFWTNTDKPFFKINPSFKFLIIAALFIVYLCVRNLNTMIWATVLFLILYFLVNGFPAKFSFWMIILTFIVSFLGTAAMILFGKGTHVLFHWYLIMISEESLARGVLIGLRTFIFTMIGMILASTTMPVPFFYSLMQQLKVPVRYAYGCLAAFRMLPMMAEEFVHIRQAMIVRGMMQKKGARAAYERMKHYALAMLAQSIRRAQRTAVAMEAKRFSMTEARTYYYEIGWSRYDLYFLVVILCTVALGFLLSHWMPLTPFTDVIDN